MVRMLYTMAILVATSGALAQMASTGGPPASVKPLLCGEVAPNARGEVGCQANGPLHASGRRCLPGHVCRPYDANFCRCMPIEGLIATAAADETTTTTAPPSEATTTEPPTTTTTLPAPASPGSP